MNYVFRHIGGEGGPTAEAPASECGTHVDVYDRRFPMFGRPEGIVDDATAQDYGLLRNASAHSAQWSCSPAYAAPTTA